LSASLLGLAVLFAAGPAVNAQDYRITAAPSSAEESALRAALGKGGPALVSALDRVSAGYPGTPTSGLAQLAAGLALLDAQKAKESLPYLVHPDIQRTLLADHAILALGRAQEALQQMDGAGQSYLAAAATEAGGPLVCASLERAGEAFVKASEPQKAVEVFERLATACPAQAPRALQRIGEVQETRGERTAAAAAYDRLDREFPLSVPAHDMAPRLLALGALAPAASPAERGARGLSQGLAFVEAGRNTDAVRAFRGIPAGALSEEEADLARVRQARALVSLGRLAEGESALLRVQPTSVHAAEAAYQRARIRYRRGGSTDGFEQVAQQHPGTPWAEEALLALANEYQKDARDDEAAPYWRRLLAENPADGKYVERACWRSAWADYRAGRYEAAAQALERTARLRPPSAATPGFLYWAGRSRAALGQIDRARQLLEETVERYKNSYHGVRARDVLARLPAAPAAAPPQVFAAAPSVGPEPGVPEPQATRVRQLLLIDRLDEAQAELLALPFSRRGQATIAWIDWRQDRLRPAISAMKRAFPEWIGEAGDRLPAEVWRILYPIRFDETLRAKAAEEGLDPSLVAALILQESTFDADALSRAGARGLMQVIPATGRKLAHELRVPYRKAALHDPGTSLDFGTRYLRQMSDRYEGQVERVLAGYNAGPHRVDAWTAARPGMSAEEFIESIPFAETRYYVMIVLANREQYRRLYALDKSPTVPPFPEGQRP
jgi:soluble lytic murein transglycosylase